MSNTQNVDPCPLERRVGLVDGETTPGTEGFGSSESSIRRNTRSTAIAPYGPWLFFLTAYAAEFFKPMFKKLLPSIRFFVFIPRHTIHYKEIRIIFIAAMVFIPSLVQAIPFFSVQMVFEFPHSPFMSGVSPFNPYIPIQRTSDNTLQSINENMPSKVLDKITIKGVSVNDGGLNFGTVSGNPSSRIVADKSADGSGNCSPYDVTDNCIEHSVFRYIGWPIGIGIGWLIFLFIIGVIEGDVQYWFRKRMEKVFNFIRPNAQAKRHGQEEL